MSPNAPTVHWINNDYKIKGCFNEISENVFHRFSNMENSLTLSQLILNEHFYMQKHDPHCAILKLYS